MSAPDERAALAAHREACGVCGSDCACWQAIDMIVATRLAAAEEQVATLTEQVGQAWDHCVTVCGPDLAAARRALAHEVYRNHEHTDACSVCAESDALLAPERPREERG